MKRDILKIDEELCNGCGLCVPNCHEGALQVIDDKVRLVSELMCDGLGACIGHCPEGAITIENREAEPYNETRVMEQMKDKGKNTVIATDYSFMKPMYDMVVAMQDDGIIMDYGELRAGSVHYSGVFWNEQVAMVPMGSWFIGSMIRAINEGDADFNWDVVKYPHPEGVEPGTTAGTLTSLAINANSKNQDAAWDFIKFYSGIEGAKALAATGNLPAIRTPEVLEVFSSLEGVPAGATEALQTATVRLELPMHPKVGAVEQILNEEHELIMTNSVSVQEGLDEMTSRISKVLEE